MSAAYRSYNVNETVKCCRECNSLLGNKCFTTVEERAEYLAEAISKKYRGSLQTANYDSEELAEMGHRLGSFIKANLNLRIWAAQRITHCRNVAGELYDDREIKHLTGLRTRRKKLAYFIMQDLLKEDGTINEVCERLANRYKVEPEMIKGIRSDKLYYDVWTQVKWERKLPLDARPIDLIRVYARLRKREQQGYRKESPDFN